MVLFMVLVFVWWSIRLTFYSKQRRDTNVVVQRFHQSLNAGDFNKICEEAYGCTGSAALVRSGWNSVLQEVVGRAGKFQVVKSSDIKAYIEPFTVKANYVCSFEKTDVREIFILRHSDDGQLRIVSYQTVTKGVGDAAQ